MKGFIYQVRRLLILVGKMLPFVLCFVVLLCSIETIYCVLSDNLIKCGEYTLLNTKMSFALAPLFDYGYLVLALLFILSISIESCIHNKLALLFLCDYEFQGDYFASVEVTTTIVICVTLINAMLCVYFVQKGIKVLIKSK